MKKDKAIELADILIAYAEGKTIQRSLIDNKWKDLEDLKGEDLKQASIPIKGVNFTLRIKPEPKLVPFTFEDNLLFRDRWIYMDLYKTTIQKIFQITKNDILLVYGAKSVRCTYSNLLENYLFEDGTKCGKYINE